MFWFHSIPCMSLEPLLGPGIPQKTPSFFSSACLSVMILNPLTPNDPCSGHIAPLTYKRCILYIYSTNIGTEYFNHGIYSPFFLSSKWSLFHNSNVFGSCIIHILYIYSTNIRTEYFKHGIYSPFVSSKCSLFYNSNIFGSCIINILYIYSTNIGTEYFKHGIYSPFFFLQNALCFIILRHFFLYYSHFVHRVC